MAKNNIASIRTKMSGIETKAEEVIRSTILEFANRVFSEAMSKLGKPALIGTFSLQVADNGYTVTILTNSAISAYVEFGTGTGNFKKTLAQYAGDEQPLVKEEAIKFYVNGLGKIAAQPYLFPPFFKYGEELFREINRRLERLFLRW